MTEAYGLPEPATPTTEPGVERVPTEPERRKVRRGRPDAAGRLILEERRARVADLVQLRTPQRQIARMENVGLSTVADDVRVIKKQWRERMLASYDAHVAEQMADLDLLLRSWMPKALDHKDPEHAARAALVVHRTLERRAKLLGLDKPVRHEVTGAGGGPIVVETVEEKVARGRALVDELTARRVKSIDVESSIVSTNGHG